MMVAPAPGAAAARVMAVMNADMHAGTDAADMNAYADLRRGGGREQKCRGKRRADQRFHLDSLFGFESPRHPHGRVAPILNARRRPKFRCCVLTLSRWRP